jgi:hypothetical protein
MVNDMIVHHRAGYRERKSTVRYVILCTYKSYIIVYLQILQFNLIHQRQWRIGAVSIGRPNPIVVSSPLKHLDYYSKELYIPLSNSIFKPIRRHF